LIIDTVTYAIFYPIALIVTIHFWIFVTESILNPITSPAVTEVVQPVRVEDEPNCAEDNVGLAEPVIVLATVGIAALVFHKSTVIEPDWLLTIDHSVIVQA